MKTSEVYVKDKLHVEKTESFRQYNANPKDINIVSKDHNSKKDRIFPIQDYHAYYRD